MDLINKVRIWQSVLAVRSTAWPKNICMQRKVGSAFLARFFGMRNGSETIMTGVIFFGMKNAKIMGAHTCLKINNSDEPKKIEC